MSTSNNVKPIKKQKPNFVYAIISITLNLFIVGLLALIIYFSQQSFTKIKESVEIELVLKKEVDSIGKVKIEEFLKSQEFIAHYKYIDKSVAAEKFAKDIGQNFVEILGFNPLYDAYVVNLKADYTNETFLKDVESKFLSVDGVEEVFYQQNIVEMLGKTIQPIAIGIAVISILLLLIAFFIIDTTIRLMMYAQRFSIRTMQLIGATEWFIVKPFLKKSVGSGIISAIIANIGLFGLLFLANIKLNYVPTQQDYIVFGIIALTLLLLGIIISTISTYFAVRKYLHVKLEDLY
ncbi:MAG: hypothetical protein H6553_07335 [Chitinophagales bacterium]|nr:hypothetical protein [Chitinophagales bacterium]